MGISLKDLQAQDDSAHPESDPSPASISLADLQRYSGQEQSPAKQEEAVPSAAQNKGNSTVGQAIGKSALTGALSGFAAKMSDYVESEFPGALSGDDGSQYPASFLNGTPQDRREYFKQQRAAVVNSYYSGVDTDNHKVVSFISQAAGSLLDPTTALAPEVKGATILARAYEMSKFGGKLGAAYGVADSLADKGNIDPINVVVSTAIGAAGGAALQTALVEPLSALAGKLLGRGRPITPDAVQSAVQSDTGGSTDTPGGDSTPIQGDMPDPHIVAAKMNEELGLTDATPESARLAQQVDNITGKTETDPALIDMDYVMGKADEFYQGLLEGKKIPESKPDYVENNQINEWMDKVANLTPDEEFQAHQPDAIDQGMMAANNLIELIKGQPELKAQVIQAHDAANAGSEMAMARTPDEKILAAVGDEQIPHGSPLAQKIEPSSIEPLPDLENLKPEDFQTVAQKFGSEWAITRPSKMWESIGPIGKQAGKDIEDYNVAARQVAGSKNVEYNGITSKYKLDAAGKSLMREVANHIADADKVPANVKAAANELRVFLNKNLDQYVDQGLMTAEDAIKFKAKGQEDGYFPRVYNRNLLKTEAGHQAFVDAIANTKYHNESSALTAVKSVLGEKNKDRLSHFIREGKAADGSTDYFLDPELGKYLWRNQSTVSEKSMSSHIELARRFGPELESTLAPFMEKDVDVAMDTYIRDTSERLMAAKIFGNNFEVAKTTFKEMFKIDPVRAKSYSEVFWTAMNDPRSSNIRSFSSRSAIVTNTSNILKSIQLLKLTMSQITNMTQLPVNGLTRVAGLEGLTAGQKLVTGVNGIFKAYGAGLSELGKIPYAGRAMPRAMLQAGQALREEAQAAGAIMESSMAHAFGLVNPESRAGQFLIGPAAIFKDPGLYLKYTGFDWTEEVNRIGGYQMGKGAIEFLLKNKAKYEALAKQNPGRAGDPRLEAVYRQLEEFGIDRNIPTDQVTLKAIKDGAYKAQAYSSDLREAILRGGQRMSNSINFVNDAHKLPLFSQSFFGKLMFQLHTFAYHQGAFFKDSVLGPAKRGNLLPLATYLGVGSAVGIPVADFKRWVIGDDKKYTLTQRWVQGIQIVAGFGLIQDLMQSASYGKQGIYSAIMGPGINSVVSMGASMGSSANVMQKNMADSGNPFKGENPLQPIGKALLSEISFPMKKKVLKSMTADKEAFDFKWHQQRGDSYDYKEPK